MQDYCGLQLRKTRKKTYSACFAAQYSNLLENVALKRDVKKRPPENEAGWMTITGGIR